MGPGGVTIILPARSEPVESPVPVSKPPLSLLAAARGRGTIPVLDTPPPHPAVCEALWPTHPTLQLAHRLLAPQPSSDLQEPDPIHNARIDASTLLLSWTTPLLLPSTTLTPRRFVRGLSPTDWTPGRLALGKATCPMGKLPILSPSLWQRAFHTASITGCRRTYRSGLGWRCRSYALRLPANGDDQLGVDEFMDSRGDVLTSSFISPKPSWVLF